jgi:hypothetical protein
LRTGPTSAKKNDILTVFFIILGSARVKATQRTLMTLTTGHHNIIALTASRVDADDSMRQLEKTERNCIFNDESSFLRLFKSYTYTNCLFECSLIKAEEKYKCIPWYFPIYYEPTKICNPWEAQKFFEDMNNIKGENCPMCLPECNNTIYETSIVTLPFRQCDLLNMEMSFLCKISQFFEYPYPKKFSPLYRNDSEGGTDPIYSQARTNRTYNLINNNRNLFNVTNKLHYDAFETDIATVEIYFKKSSAIQMGRQSRMNWIDYFSTVGGLLGLVLGMGFVSFIELFWLGLRLLARYLHFNEWIS